MAEISLQNDTEYEFKDISSEKYRHYDFAGVDVRIENPQYLAVSENGHRVLDASGRSHYIAYDGFYFYWESKVDQPHFVK